MTRLFRHALSAVLLAASVGCGPAITVHHHEPERQPEPVAASPTVFPDGWQPAAPPVRDGASGALGGPVPRGLRGQIWSIEWSPHGDVVAVTTSEKEVALIDVRTGVIRAYKRVMVRREDVVNLVGFDPTGTRLVLHAYDYERGHIVVWDLHEDEFHTVQVQESQEAQEAPFICGAGIITQDGIHNRYIPFEGDAGSFPVGTPVGMLSQGTQCLLQRGGETMRVSVAGETLGTYVGSLLSVHPTGAAFIVRDGETLHVHRSDGTEVGAIRITDGTLMRADWTRSALFLDVRPAIPEAAVGETPGDRPAPYRAEYDNTLAEVARYEIPGDSFGLVGHASLHSETAEGQFTVRPLTPLGEAASEPTHRLLEAWAEDEDVPYDEMTGEEIRVGRYTEGPAGTFLVARGRELYFLNQAFEIVGTSTPAMGGESSIWGTRDDPSGGYTWARAGTEYWGPEGAVRFTCDQGNPLEVEGLRAWANDYQLCVDGREPRRLQSGAENVERRIIGTRDNDLLVANIGAADPPSIQIWDPVRWRAKRTILLPPGTTVECYDDYCPLRYFPLGRGGLVVDDNQAYWDSGRGRLQVRENLPINNIQARPTVILMGGHGFSLLDARGRVAMQHDDASMPVLSADGSTVAYWDSTASQAVVAAVPGGEMRMQATLAEGEPVRILLEGDLVAFRHEQQQAWTIWHVPSNSQRVRLGTTDTFALLGGSRIAVCSDDQLTLRSGLDGSVTDQLGGCALADDLSTIENGHVLVVRSRTRATFVRLSDGARIEVGNVRGPNPSAFAFQGARGWLDANAGASLRWRGPGPIATATMEEDPTPHHDPDFLRAFFAPPPTGG